MTAPDHPPDPESSRPGQQTEAAKAPETLHDLLDAMAPHDGQERVFVRDILDRVGSRSFPAVILVPAILLVSPISGVPGTPTIGALIILLIAAQALLQRSHLWLPDVLMRRSLTAERMSAGLSWLKKPAGWMDRLSRARLTVLSSGPFKLVAYAVTICCALTWPLLEVLPFITSFSAGAVSMVMFGLMTRDGLWLIAGYTQISVIYLTLLSIWSGLL